MKDLMKYKDYFGSVHYNDDDRIFHGRVEFIRALVSYEGTDVESLRRTFEEAVDDYLELCHKQKTEPEKPFKGSFNVRVGPRLHQEIALNAMNEGLSLNQYITWVLEKESREGQESSRNATVMHLRAEKGLRDRCRGESCNRKGNQEENGILHAEVSQGGPDRKEARR